MKRTLFIAASIVIVGAAIAVGLTTKKSSMELSTPNASSPIVSTPQTTTISGIVVPHHNLVQKERTTLFNQLKQTISPPQTIILIAPNHYDTGKNLVQTTNQDWDITDGSLRPNKEVIAELIKTGSGNEPESFANEHGIKLLLPDIKQAFPNATIVPLIFKTQTTITEVQKVHDTLLKECPHCLMIASVDFSHYQPALLADLHDTLAERALDTLNPELLTQSEVDSPSALLLLAQWATSHDTKKFVLKNHTNSGIIASNPDIATTTHFFGWYEKGDQTKAEDSVSFIIGGDMMFGRFIAHTFLNQGLEKSFDTLGNRVFWGTDARIVNLEGPVSETSVPDNIEPNNLTFNFPPETIKALQFLKINVASLANNHSANAGTKGLATTRRLLNEARIQPLGGPNESDAPEIATIHGQNITLYLVGVHAVFSKPNIVPVIQKLRLEPNSRIIIFPHWGSEYIYKHNSTQQELAHSWIDAGADLVVGAHPHVIEDSELYKGKPIIYSMGNFIFDQTFSPETQQGLFIAGQFTKNELRLFALPHQSTQLKPALLQGDAKAAILNKLYEPFVPFKKATPAGELLVFPK